MKWIQEFKEFAMRGNVVDLAVGIIIGGAFGKIVSSFVDDIIMPPLGILIGGVDFKDLAIVLKPAEGEAAAVMLRYGKFVQNTFDFLIVAFAIFMMIQLMNRLRKKEPEAAPETPGLTPDQELLTEIRDLLKNR